MRKDTDQWWRNAVIYQIYPRSFKDSNNDGLGDLQGVISRLDYLQELGIDAIWLSPHYPSPQADNGYDVSDYFDVNPEYGTLKDFDHMVAEASKRNIRIIVDLVPNHSSQAHKWFQEALAAGPNSPERERYIFRHSPSEPPNNWGSMFGGPAWSRVDELTGKEDDKNWWYLHLFAPEQPDFNWNHPDVHTLFTDFLRFWASRGVHGFRVDVAHALVKADGLPNDDVGPDRWAGKKEGDEATDRGPFFDQDGVHDIYREWRKVLDEFGKDYMMVAEAWVDPPSRAALYVREDEMSQAFNFDYLKAGWFPDRLRDVIDSTMHENAQVGAPVTWVLSNHDVVRHSSRFGFEPGYNTIAGIGHDDPQPDRDLGLTRARAISTFTFGLPGSVYIYQGEELGLPEVTDLPDDARKDPTWLRTGQTVRGRDGCRVPLPWDSKADNAGFGGQPWLPMPDYWPDFAVDTQIGRDESTLELYRHTIALRKKYSLGKGDFKWVDLGLPDHVLCAQNGQVLLILNMGDEPVEFDGVKKLLISSSASVAPIDVEANDDSSGGSYKNAKDLNHTVEIPGNCAVWLIADN